MLTQTLTYRATLPKFVPQFAPDRVSEQANDDLPSGPSATPRPVSFGMVTPRRLIALGVLANLLFWGGLLTPYNALANPLLAHLHVSLTILGLGLALGGAAAVVTMVIHQMTVRLFSPELTAGVLHFTVVTAFAVMSLAAFLRGWGVA